MSEDTFVEYGILGCTGLVGQTLYYQMLADGIADENIARFHSSNAAKAPNTSYGILFVCCMPAVKWWANQNPAADKATLEQVLDVVGRIDARTVVLISTIDVIALAEGQVNDETSTNWSTHTYGVHRRLLEEAVTLRWPETSHIIRLPALFGRGLKKNALFDLLNGKDLAVSRDAAFQWYDLARLWNDCWECMIRRFHLVHFVTPPVAMSEIVDRWFPGVSCASTGNTAYNFTTRHGHDGPYWVGKESVMAEMGRWICWERWRTQHNIAVSNIGFTMTNGLGYGVMESHSLRYLGINCLEIAPTRGTNFANFPVLSMQSLIYGSGITNIFRESEFFMRHMFTLVVRSRELGVKVYLFGSPKQRHLGTTTAEEAVALFRRLGNLMANEGGGATLCIEPNARDYGATWLTNIADALAFVKEVNHPNIRLAIDTGNYVMEGDTWPVRDIPVEWVGHCQVSAAHLAHQMNRQEVAAAEAIVGHLWASGYEGIVSWESREESSYCVKCNKYDDCESRNKWLTGVMKFVEILQNSMPH